MTNHNYYTSSDGLECIDVLRNCLTQEEYEGFCKGNIIKYIWRESGKGGLNDIRKARDYIDYLIESRKNDKKTESESEEIIKISLS